MQCISTLGQLAQDVGHVHQLDPVELQIGAGGEMAEALVIVAGDMGQLAHLPAGQGAVGHGDAQHIGVQLQIEPVHQPQRLELVFGQVRPTGGAPPGRRTARPARHELGVEFVIAVHVGIGDGLLAGVGTDAGARRG